MPAPLWQDPGQTQGRIAPAIVSASEGQYAYCLGVDASYLSSHYFGVGDSVYVEQLIDLTTIAAIRFTWKMRTTAMAAPIRLVTDVEFKNGGLLLPGDALQGAILSAVGPLPSLSTQRSVLRVAGTISNDGDHVLGGVLQNQGEVQESGGSYTNGQVLLIEPSGPAIVNEVAPGATLTILGGRWVAVASVGGAVRLEHTEPPNRAAVVERSLLLNVSKLTGAHDVRFALRLDAVAA